jgi:hypothetical protein
MDEDLEQWTAQMVSMLTSEEYERYGPGLQEFGLAVAELRQVQRELRSSRPDRIQVLKQALEDLDEVAERAYNARRLWEDDE